MPYAGYTARQPSNVIKRKGGCVHIVRGRPDGTRSELRTANFTGDVWGDPVLPETDGVLVNNVFFAPGARTHWHSHDHGQLLLVTAGEGCLFDREGRGGLIRLGDLAFIPPDREHWHGATAASFLVHLAISLGGHRWLNAVDDDEYALRAGAGR